MRPEAVFNSTAETLGQITHHLEAARWFQPRRKRCVVGDDTIDHRVRARQLDLDRAVPSVKIRMPRGVCHELVDSQCKAPAPFRFERQGVGHECETYAIRLEGPADSESERANAFSGIDQPTAIWEAQNAMNLRMLLQQIDDIATADTTSIEETSSLWIRRFSARRSALSSRLTGIDVVTQVSWSLLRGR